jgi:RNA polymerase sigma-70 factor, ECF subfamily
MNDLNDKDLIAGCVSGRNNALEELVSRYSDPVYRVVQYTFKARNISYSQQDLEDLHNTVFLDLFEKQCRKLRQYKGKNGCSLHSWIRMITVRTVIDHLRKGGVDALGWQKNDLPDEFVESLRPEQPQPWADIDRADQWSLVQNGMKDLLPRDRLFLKLHFLERLSIGEVAEIMGLSESNAHSLKHRAIKRLKEKVLVKGSSG